MTTRITGTPIQSDDGITIDTPTAALDMAAQDLLFLAGLMEMPVIMPDRKVSRRLTAHVTIDPVDRVISAYGTIMEGIRALAGQGREVALIATIVEPYYIEGFTIDLSLCKSVEHTNSTLPTGAVN